MPNDHNLDPRSAISRARFFLEKAKDCRVETRNDCEAFMEASIVFARAAIHRLKTRYEKHSQWKVWWTDVLNVSAVQFFRIERDWILKEASPKIGQVVYLPSISLNRTTGNVTFEPSDYPTSAAHHYYFEAPNIPATITIEKHLNQLEEVLSKGTHLFDSII